MKIKILPNWKHFYCIEKQEYRKSKMPNPSASNFINQTLNSRPVS